MYSLLNDAPPYRSSSEYDSSTNSLHINSLHNRFSSYYTRPTPIAAAYAKQKAIIWAKKPFGLTTQYGNSARHSAICPDKPFYMHSSHTLSPTFSHWHTHTHTLLLGWSSRGGGIPSSLTYWNPPFLSLLVCVRACVSLSLWRPLSMYFKRCQSAPTNSISCGRPLPNIPLLYSVPSLSLLLLHFHSYPQCAFSLLPDIDLYFSSLLFVFSPHTYTSVHKFAQPSDTKKQNRSK